MESKKAQREIRKSTAEDLPTIIELINQGRMIMRENGNMNQWTKGDPKPEVLKKDISQGNSYIITDDGVPVATFVFIAGPDETYAKIYEGKWLDECTPYHVIHRIAKLPSAHGIFQSMIDYCFSKTRNIRIDTHRDNSIMQHLLTSAGFKYCGIIYLNDGAERFAYQLMK